MRVALAQFTPRPGDIDGNLARMRARRARVVYGTADAPAGALRNVIVLTGPGGQTCRYAKTHMVSSERMVFTAGDSLVLDGDGDTGSARFCGGSRVVGPLGHTLLQMGATDGLASADLDLDWVARLRSSADPATYPLLTDRRPPLPVHLPRGGA